MTTHTEDKREIPGYPGYYASRDGKIYKSDVEVAPRLSPLRQTGYNSVAIPRTEGPGSTAYRILSRAKLILLAFVGQPPKGMVARHKNGDKTDDRLDNLIYASRSHALTPEQVTRQEVRDHVREMIQQGATWRQIREALPGVTFHTYNYIRLQERGKHGE